MQRMGAVAFVAISYVFSAILLQTPFAGGYSRWVFQEEAGVIAKENGTLDMSLSPPVKGWEAYESFIRSPHSGELHKRKRVPPKADCTECGRRSGGGAAAPAAIHAVAEALVVIEDATGHLHCSPNGEDDCSVTIEVVCNHPTEDQPETFQHCSQHFGPRMVGAGVPLLAVTEEVTEAVFNLGPPSLWPRLETGLLHSDVLVWAGPAGAELGRWAGASCGACARTMDGLDWGLESHQRAQHVGRRDEEVASEMEGTDVDGSVGSDGRRTAGEPAISPLLDSLGGAEMAEMWLQQQLGVDDSDWALWSDLGMVCRARGQWTEALQLFNTARLKQAAEHSELYLNMGQAQYLLGHMAEAIGSFREGLHIDGQSLLLRMSLGITLMRRGGELAAEKEALMHLEHVEMADPDYLQVQELIQTARGQIRAHLRMAQLRQSLICWAVIMAVICLAAHRLLTFFLVVEIVPVAPMSPTSKASKGRSKKKRRLMNQE